jgi:hypothetical protein
VPGDCEGDFALGLAAFEIAYGRWRFFEREGPVNHRRRPPFTDQGL